jgi:hypothetical protein
MDSLDLELIPFFLDDEDAIASTPVLSVDEDDGEVLEASRH